MTLTPDVVGTMEDYAAAIRAAGIRCALDARDVNPPAVLIRPPVVQYRFGRGCIGANWTAWLMLPDAGQLNAARAGYPILATVFDALATCGVAMQDATPGDFQAADGATLPGFTITWTATPKAAKEPVSTGYGRGGYGRGGYGGGNG